MKTATKVRAGIMAIMAALLIIISGCRKVDMPAEQYIPVDPGTIDDTGIPRGQAAMRLSATPFHSLKMVNVEIIEIAVQYGDGATDQGRWMNLPVTPKVYNVLKLVDGLPAILANYGNLYYGQIAKVRIVFGYRNSVITHDGRIYPLRLQESNRASVIDLKAQISRASKAIMTFKFDTEASVNFEGSGLYILKPMVELNNVEYESIINEQ